MGRSISFEVMATFLPKKWLLKANKKKEEQIQLAENMQKLRKTRI